ncbi:hypothetical protein [Methylobacterium sp. E-046]|uniref:hypothetical protein n=1 Tax=Methylobacterium sp. E-046 TaxID=2836576 RepID=UPI001FB9A61D|nr:hypothetical protein [Methylobacterium sp. E-046]MCJ2098912.1 hypothetical protein [Methylobacterium sp. E-046]
MADEPEALMDPFKALKIIEMLVDVAEEADNPVAADLILREIRNVLAKTMPKKPRRRPRKA